MSASYRSIILDRTAEHRHVLNALAEESLPALMHCAAGKDRAASPSRLSLLAVGVEREAIEADYLKSNDPHRRYRYAAAIRPPADFAGGAGAACAASRRARRDSGIYDIKALG